MSVSRPAAIRARYAPPSAAPSGTAAQSTGSSGAVGQRLDPVVDAHAAPGGDDPTRVAARGLDRPAGHEARGLERGPADRGRVVRQVEVGEQRAPVGIVDRHTLATRVRHPDGNAPGVGDLPAPRDQTPRPVEEEPADVARPADEQLAACGVGHGEVARGFGR